MRSTLAAALLGVAACSGSPPPVVAPPPKPPASTLAPAASEPPPDAVLATKESKTVARTLAKVSQLRGVKANKPVPGVKLERDQLVGRVKDKALREFPADALRREGQLLQLFGFAPAGFDYLTEMMKLLESQLEGFYEPQNGTMYLAADLRGKEAQATLAHELVHALQDQNWDLKTRSTYRPGRGDESLALACLAEGDATSLMMDYVLAEQNKTALDLPEAMIREMMETGMTGASIASVPHILRTTLIAPYIEGLAFVHALRKQGGWPRVDQAWATPPTTSEQILHVDKWDKHEPALAVAAPTAAALGSGFVLADEDTFGELGFALAYEEWIDTAEARTAASGWGGDRSAIWTKGDELAFSVHQRFDAAPGRADATFGDRAFGLVSRGMKKHLGKAAIDRPDTVCFERKELGPLLLSKKGRELVMIAGPARASAATWSSTSTCATAKKWADEIAAMP